MPTAASTFTPKATSSFDLTDAGKRVRVTVKSPEALVLVRIVESMAGSPQYSPGSADASPSADCVAETDSYPVARVDGASPQERRMLSPTPTATSAPALERDVGEASCTV